jgi:hypothetical protein
VNQTARKFRRTGQFPRMGLQGSHGKYAFPDRILRADQFGFQSLSKEPFLIEKELPVLLNPCSWML